eukprot:CAMPEP_0176499732 /NCGR_PEP_ID=MMETSP0200_2-20121128/13102_1 /TAXON_ID=947934 /ORGANISM="Chaetoceros sp., Strain GSL56" /LENGTH=93 /DNA_ID=CAMNT_0017898207 /DNA_START=128 /DNA_END=409 /DNA_ORIENTATION=+
MVSVQPLHLHPDQAQELEAAASEVFSQQHKQDKEDDPDDDIVAVDESAKYHDDTKHDKESPLSAASATSSLPLRERGSWSKSFFGFISRNRGK